MALFNKLPAPDRSKTQLAYILNYYPKHLMPPRTAELHIAYSMLRYIPKYRLVQLCNEERTHITLIGHSTAYKIQWAFNNIPTELEWDRKGDGYLISVEFRISPITGPVALLSFGTVKHINAAWSA